MNNLAAFFLSILAAFNISFAILPEKKASPQPPPVLVTKPDGLTAKSFFVFDLNTLEPLGGLNTAETLPIASLTKIMTAYAALKELPLDADIRISSEALRTTGLAGNFKAGEVFTLKDLLTAMMVYSSNDAAVAVAEELGARLGGNTFDEKMTRAVDRMNELAKNLGMRNTSFQNPAGVDTKEKTPSNYASAEDLAKLLKATQDLPIWPLSRARKKIIYSKGGVAHHLLSTDPFLERIPYPIGGKTGTTDAGESLVLLFEYPLGRQIGFIILDSSSGMRLDDAARLLGQVMPVVP